MNILFVCKHNVFRSKTAEAYFKKINKNKSLHAESAGFIKADWIKKPKRNEEVINYEKNAVKKRGINIGGISRTLSISLIQRQDLIIVISDDLPNIFTEMYIKKGLKVRIWKIKDIIPKNYSEKNLDYTINWVMKKVEDLVEELKCD